MEPPKYVPGRPSARIMGSVSSFKPAIFIPQSPPSIMSGKTHPKCPSYSDISLILSWLLGC